MLAGTQLRFDVAEQLPAGARGVRQPVDYEQLLQSAEARVESCEGAGRLKKQLVVEDVEGGLRVCASFR